MGIVDNIKSVFKSKNNKEQNAYIRHLDFYHISQNNLIDLTHRAAKMCIAGKVETDIEKQKLNVARVMGYGHESILEHSNLIIALEFAKTNDIKELLEFTDGLKYLNHHTYEEANKENMIMIIGGSIRGFKHVIRNVDNKNIYVNYLKMVLYEYTPSTLYEDFIKDGIMNPNRFKEYNIPVESGIVYNDNGEEVVSTDRVELINLDSIVYINNKIKEIVGYNIPIRDLLDFCTATVLFKRLSRTASHQLVRHRNGITQESQRYVDYGNASFINPLEEEAIANNSDIPEFSKKLNEIADYCIKSYNDLRAEGMAKQDARAILPNNVATRLYMTFTFTNLIKFLELRTAKGAQAEIRNIANDLKQLFMANMDIFDNESDMYSYLEPVYKEIEQKDYSSIDEPEEDIRIDTMSLEEIVEFSEQETPKELDYDIEVNTEDDLKNCDTNMIVKIKTTDKKYKYVSFKQAPGKWLPIGTLDD